MKTKAFLILFVASAMLAACTHKVCCTPPVANFIHVKSGISEWDLAAPLAEVTTDSLTLVGHGTEQGLTVRIKFNGTGKYMLTGQQLKYYRTIGSDAMVAEYFADPAAESVLYIRTYEQDSKTITGDFVMNFLKSPRYVGNEAAYPLKFTFNTGTFKIQLAK